MDPDLIALLLTPFPCLLLLLFANLCSYLLFLCKKRTGVIAEEKYICTILYV